jgi:hypothetical protein
MGGPSLWGAGRGRIALLLLLILLWAEADGSPPPQERENEPDTTTTTTWQARSSFSNVDFLQRNRLPATTIRRPAAEDAFDFFGMWQGPARGTTKEEASSETSDGWWWWNSDESPGAATTTTTGNTDFWGRLTGKKSATIAASENPNKDQHDSSWQQHLEEQTSPSEGFLTKLFLQAGTPERQEGFMDVSKVFFESWEQVRLQMNETFGDLELLERFDLIQLLFFMDYEEEVKNPVWKRRQHRHYRALTTPEAEGLYPGLYLAYLAYTTTCQSVYQHSQQFGGGAWALRNCSMEVKPHNPAHFVLVRKPYETMLDLGPLDFLNHPIRALSGEDTLEVALVIRGTKTIGDMLTDSVLKPVDYRDGLAHEGILRAAKWLYETYREDLRQLLEDSGRRRLKLWLVGHSLGAGTAALAAIEFLEGCSDWMTAEALGFGTPAVLSHNLSYKYRDVITTVVTDADAVPRMSGATLANAWLRIASHDFGDALLVEYDLLMKAVQSKLVVGQSVMAQVAQDLRTWIEQRCNDTLRPQIASNRNSTPTFRKPALIPPGECVHLYRDGTAWQGNYVNCSFFNEVDVAWHLVDDHMIPVRSK